MSLLEPEPEHARPLRDEDLDPDPLRVFGAWLDDAAAHGVRLPEAMALATVGPGGAPSVRMLLLKGFDEDGFVFYTNTESRKGRELAASPRAALAFYWDAAGRQVRIEGTVSRVTREEAEEYFRTRPLGSRLGAWASPQSEPIESREELEARVAELAREFGDDPPLPPHWGGYRLSPEAIEFWQHREDRLHDRFEYRRTEGGWRRVRLAP
jgi:pyridoxamine 5'-phosphate oxidase